MIQKVIKMWGEGGPKNINLEGRGLTCWYFHLGGGPYFFHQHPSIYGTLTTCASAQVSFIMMIYANKNAFPCIK